MTMGGMVVRWLVSVASQRERRRFKPWFGWRDNNFIKDFPQLADGLMVIPLPVEEQCRGVLSEPLPNLQLLSGFSKVLKTLSADSTREELLAFLQEYGSHYVSEALYGSELSCSIYFPSKKAQQQLWLQYQKGERAGRQEDGPNEGMTAEF
ncbi:unnamed protein product [Pleuronectes platessa]|uniref:MACPF domain-containing protein n=1 Tax=Pleuronectes platessa TaxID=8262 RepID=A0A9N7V616_PLEPL|nr:unnamed protein product [Pleuronectes platessa]